ncbi:hypothetical protein KUL25_09630 [Rhodobacteraceae bacterium N5(2021)]|uniref:Uncharacterized protein n=1 Tax=Gymnodinialimonas phycosphaerae TaxID=2841589 RepID=A0ABS7MSH9_9RHOB|nr:hypothetical protein [Gymnodinialimonas phycosphaerae]MBY4893023.1 hypothetical protein [Gymnodinialimonas phycosphaerae]
MHSFRLLLADTRLARQFLASLGAGLLIAISCVSLAFQGPHRVQSGPGLWSVAAYLSLLVTIVPVIILNHRHFAGRAHLQSVPAE